MLLGKLNIMIMITLYDGDGYDDNDDNNEND